MLLNKIGSAQITEGKISLFFRRWRGYELSPRGRSVLKALERK